MKYSDIYLIKARIDQMKVIQDAMRVVNDPAIRQNFQLTSLNETYDLMSRQLPSLSLSASNCLKTLFTNDIADSYKLMLQSIEERAQLISQLNSYKAWGVLFGI